jgi:hypothetical protein
MIPPFRQRMARHTVVKIALNHQLTLGCLLALFILIIAGTLFQSGHGLYEAQRRFFGFGLLLGGWFPMPGAGLLMWILSLQIVVTMLFVLPLTWKKLGLWIIHIGLLLLLAGGFITQTMAVESELTLAEGETGHFTTAYHEWEVAFWKTHGDTNEVLAYADRYLYPKAVLDLSPCFARLTVEQYFDNAAAFTDQAAGGAKPFLNASGITFMESRPPEKEAGYNSPGLIATLSEKGREDRKILLYGMEEKPLVLKLGEQWVFCQLRRKHHPLPFALKLTRFTRDLHPGTEMAKNYESHADLQDGLSSRPVKIWMNNPLRYKGYTFFQASFGQDPRGLTSTFAVVTNPGRLLPYVSSLMVFGGMLLHFVIRFLGHAKRKARP